MSETVSEARANNDKPRPILGHWRKIYVGALFNWLFLCLLAVGLILGAKKLQAFKQNPDPSNPGSVTYTPIEYVADSWRALAAVVVIMAILALSLGLISWLVKTDRAKAHWLLALVSFTPFGNLVLVAMTGGIVKSPFVPLYVSAIAVILAFRRSVFGAVVAVILASFGVMIATFAPFGTQDFGPITDDFHHWLIAISTILSLAVAGVTSNVSDRQWLAPSKG